MRTWLGVATFLGLVLLAAPAFAHISLTFPAKRYDLQKSGPCGVAGGQKTSNVTVFEPGETITVTWDETINHPGHYRISFDADGDDDFVVPASYTDFNSAPSVLVDDIADQAGGSYAQQITLPDIECESCTLQLIQVMLDKPPYGDGNDVYFQCADIALRAPADAGVGGSATGGQAGAAGTTGTGGTSSGGTSGLGGSTGGSSSGGGDDGGCGCRAARGRDAWPLVLGALGIVLVFARKSGRDRRPYRARGAAR